MFVQWEQENDITLLTLKLGESIVAAGVGISGMVLGAGVIVAVVVRIALGAALLWAYLDLVMIVAERRLCAAQGEERGWRGTPTATCTCRWSQGSYSSLSA